MPDAKHRQMELMLAPAQEKLIGRDAATLCRNAGALLEIVLSTSLVCWDGAAAAGRTGSEL